MPILEIGMPMFFLALVSSFFGGWLSMNIFVISGGAQRTIGDSVQKLKAFRRTIGQARRWASLVGLIIGLIVAYLYTYTDLSSSVGALQYLWVWLGSMSCGFITASGFFGWFGGTGTEV